MSIKIGDKIKLLNEPFDGVVMGFLSSNIVIVEVDGFEYEYPLSEIIKVDESNAIHHIPEYVDIDFEEKKPPRAIVKPVRKFYEAEVFDSVNSRGIPEIDLHIEELISDKSHLTNGEILEIQIHALERFIEKCTSQHTNQFVVIHGVGQGVLKSEVHKLLKSYGNMRFEHGWLNEYGYGATLVKIKGLFSG